LLAEVIPSAEAAPFLPAIYSRPPALDTLLACLCIPLTLLEAYDAYFLNSLCGFFLKSISSSLQNS
jgi:hypothetical protein